MLFLAEEGWINEHIEFFFAGVTVIYPWFDSIFACGQSDSSQTI